MKTIATSSNLTLARDNSTLTTESGSMLGEQRPKHVPKFENWNTKQDTGYTSYFEGALVVRGAKPGHEEQSNKEDEGIRCQIFGNKPRAEGMFPPSTTGQKSQGGNIRTNETAFVISALRLRREYFKCFLICG